MSVKFVFLDFDGVLHTCYGDQSTLWLFLPRVESVLRDFPEPRIVISSSWADGHSLDELRAFFSPDVALRIVDKLSVRRHRIQQSGERGNACLSFCRRHKLKAGDWIAIDDTADLFRQEHPLIYCINGFRDTQELQLRMALADEIPAWRFAFDAIDQLFDFEFDRNAPRTRNYVLTHRPDFGDGRTISELLFARRRRPIEQHLDFLSCRRPPRKPLSEEEMVERYGYAVEQCESSGQSNREGRDVLYIESLAVIPLSSEPGAPSAVSEECVIFSTRLPP
jgi:hypothetical protein